MNFLLRSASIATHRPVIEPSPTAPEPPAETTNPTATLNGLIAEESFPQYPPLEDHDRVPGGSGGDDGSENLSAKICGSAMDKFSDVSKDEGWIAIPYKEIPDSLADICSLRSLDRSFVFPGEQLQVFACLSASKGETDIITPFKIAEVMSRNGNGHMSDGESLTQNGKESLGLHKDVTDGESLLRREDHKRQTEELLCRFQKSHFFVRIAESGEPLWSKKSSFITAPETDEMKEREKERPCASAFIDRGDFDPNVAGGVARSSSKCRALPNGDIVVSLQVNVVDSPRDPVIEILQFEKEERDWHPENHNKTGHADKDPFGDLLKWLIPLERTFPQPSPSSSTPTLSSSPGISSSTSQRSAALSSTSSSSQLFSFGHFRSHSMSSLPPNTAPVPGPIKARSSKSSFEIEDCDSHSAQEQPNGLESGAEELLSFRGVALEGDRFSVRCGLEGICIPGRRWRRKLEIIQPLQIRSFAADCNTDDLLCVQIKNVAAAHTPDIEIYVDAITIVLEEAGRSATPSAMPTACIEAGDGHSLPNLALRRGEEHSFIMKPASSASTKLSGETKGMWSSGLSLPSVDYESKKGDAKSDEYAVMVSCRSNFTGSRLFFKQPTSWRPRTSRDMMICVASEMSGEPRGPHGRASQLPVQILTLEASNMTREAMSMTVVAPGSFATSSNSSDVVPTGALVGSTHLWLPSRIPLGWVPAQSTARVKLELLPLTDGIITLDTLEIHVNDRGGRRYKPEQSLKINAVLTISTAIY